ncbi:hypothetical protein C8A03DRAFT_16072 [Achaetomium macrosporum]|uniref:Uncharacterized protein n=1 Tax=Achaetomium macrosporum TaxID=79813 RepID=A0AAN7C9Q1_9PEZI|nr:hypothetical protein C8A03DRAFT_16072 [Achaetomium macrosporum]
MWLKKRSREASHPDVVSRGPEIRCQPVAIQHIANFSYPRTDFVHLYSQEQPEDTRASRGSESSPPTLVEDHGSDLSVEDDSQYRATGADLWDSWHIEESEGHTRDRPALLKSSCGAQERRSQHVPSGRRHNPSTTRDPALSSGSQSSQASQHVFLPCPEHQLHTPRVAPKVSYSLLPPAEIPRKRLPVPLQSSSDRRPVGLEPSPLSPYIRPTAHSRNATSSGRRQEKPGHRSISSRAITPSLPHGGSIGASSSDSIPLLRRSPGPTPPASPSATSSSEVRISSERPSRALPRAIQGSASHTHLRHPSLSKNATRSTPSLANLAKSDHQAQASDIRPQRPSNPAGFYDRPLPPLPIETARPPTPPTISVFESDSDDDSDDAGDGRQGGARNFARRFLHDLVHHHPRDRRRKAASAGLEHKRSVSDEGPSSSPPKERGRIGLARTLNAAARYHRRGGDGTGDGDSAAAARRAAVSMDLPRDRDGRQLLPYRQVPGPEDEAEKGGGTRFWSGRSSNEFFGRIMRRKR